MFTSAELVIIRACLRFAHLVNKTAPFGLRHDDSAERLITSTIDKVESLLDDPENFKEVV